jgi:hypothetical protein
MFEYQLKYDVIKDGFNYGSIELINNKWGFIGSFTQGISPIDLREIAEYLEQLNSDLDVNNRQGVNNVCI